MYDWINGIVRKLHRYSLYDSHNNDHNNHSISKSIAAKPPLRFLELGCGNGLLLFQLLAGNNHSSTGNSNTIGRYTATDFSGTTLQLLKNRIQFLISSERPSVLTEMWKKGEIELEKRRADNLEDIRDNYYDTIVLNSVVQYFPSLR